MFSVFSVLRVVLLLLFYVKGSLWESLDDSKADFDISKLEAAFGAKVQASDAGGGKGGKKGGDGGMGGKPKKVVLVDPKRNQNVSIALAKFRMPYPYVEWRFIYIGLYHICI